MGLIWWSGWLGLCVSPAEGTGSISGQRAKISQKKPYVLLYVHRIFLKDTQEPFNIFSFVEVDQLFIV